jgi:mRNA interferase MazF
MGYQDPRRPAISTHARASNPAASVAGRTGTGRNTRFRLRIEPDQGNGLESPSRIMVDKVATVRRSRLGTKVGVLDDTSVLRLNRALVVFVGIASSALSARSSGHARL